MSSLKSLINRLFSKGVCVASKCGHSTKLVGEISAFGESTTTHMPRNAAGSTDYCLECIQGMAIPCAWCGKPIFIGDPITLYTPRPKNNAEFKIPTHAVVYQRNPLQLVGCLRWSCADSGADRSGFWIPGPDGKGMVRRVQNAFEQLLNRNGEAVIIGDLNDQRAAVDLGEKDIKLATARLEK